MVAVGEFPGVTFACVGRLHLPAAQQIGSFSVYFFPNFSNEQEFGSSHLWLLYFNPSFCQYAHLVKSNQLDIVIKWEKLFSWWHCWLTSHKDGYSISSSSHQLICLSFQILIVFPVSAPQRIEEGQEVRLKHLLPVLTETDPGVQGGVRHHRQRQGRNHHRSWPEKGLWGEYTVQNNNKKMMHNHRPWFSIHEIHGSLVMQEKYHFLGHLLAPLLDKGTKSNGTSL